MDIQKLTQEPLKKVAFVESVIPLPALSLDSITKVALTFDKKKDKKKLKFDL